MAQDLAPERRFLAAAYSWWTSDDLPPKDLPYKYLTHVSHCFVLGDKDGNLVLRDRVPDRALVKTAHENGVRVTLALGGQDSNAYFSPMAARPGALERFAKSAVALMRNHGYDGLEIDWEFPEGERGKEGVSRLARALRRGLDQVSQQTGKKHGLTMAVPASDWYGRWFDATALLKTVPTLAVMAYDAAGTWSDRADHHAPLFAPSADRAPGAGSAAASMKYWLNRGWPANRLKLGLPSYGRGFSASQPHEKIKKGEILPISGVDYKEVPGLMAQGWKRQWDEESQAPWLLSPDGDQIIGYDDEESIGAKVRWAKEQGFYGVFFWALDKDRLVDGQHPLLKAAAQAWL